jgi:hypothetical protein
MILHLGVIDIPYANAPKEYKAHKDHVTPGTETTGNVAVWLENKYHVMETYYELRGQFVADALAESLKSVLEDLMMGAPVTIDPFGSGTSQIESDFKATLSQRLLEGIIPGTPTMAAQKGVSRRFKSGYGPLNRPSFIDTGLYQASFKSWIT